MIARCSDTVTYPPQLECTVRVFVNSRMDFKTGQSLLKLLHLAGSRCHVYFWLRLGFALLNDEAIPVSWLLQKFQMVSAFLGSCSVPNSDYSSFLTIDIEDLTLHELHLNDIFATYDSVYYDRYPHELAKALQPLRYVEA